MAPRDTPDDQGLLTTGQAAERAGVNIETIRRWADRGLLPCLRTPMNHRRFRAEDVDAVYRPDPASADTVSVA